MFMLECWKILMDMAVWLIFMNICFFLEPRNSLLKMIILPIFQKTEVIKIIIDLINIMKFNICENKKIKKNI